MNLKNFKNKSSRNWIIITLLALGLSEGILLAHENNLIKSIYLIRNVPDSDINDDAKIKEIESYLDSISNSYISDVKYLADEHKQQSWGCGPSSYALAKIINKKFFNNALVIDAAYNNNNTNEIVQRFSFHLDENYNLVDHAWIEIYLGKKFIFIDPTIGQFGKINKIAYQEFDIDDQNVSKKLEDEYGITDVRMKALVKKAVNRIPAEQEPYPGFTISKEALSYYLDVREYRDQVDDGIEPSDWTEWVNYLLKKYN